MEKFDLFKDLTERTGGDIYLGVVGPVRTGKSTFIKRFMELLVLPNIGDANARQRAVDQLPQSGTGKTIMTTEPKFIPEEAATVKLGDNIQFQVRMVDCVGYAVPGALGYQEDEGPRMVLTPWFEEEIPFEEAAEVGTRKVIADHSTIGLVVTTDGTVTDLPRSNYIAAEERVIRELKELGKPFVIVLNTARPFAPETITLKDDLEARYDLPVIPVNSQEMTVEDISAIMHEVLFEFPVRELSVSMPKWIMELPNNHWLRAKYDNAVTSAKAEVKRLRDVDGLVQALGIFEFVEDVALQSMDLGAGVAVVAMAAPHELFYQILSEQAGTDMRLPEEIMRNVRQMAIAKREYDKVADAIEAVRETGYGIVPPSLSEMILEEPEIIRQGNRFGVRLKASAPSFHFIRVDVESEVAPIVGTEKQSEELVKYLLDEFEADPQKLWQSNLFGKSLHTLVSEGIQNKLYKMPPNAQEKLQQTLQRIVNEGSGGLIAILL